MVILLRAEFLELVILVTVHHTEIWNREEDLTQSKFPENPDNFKIRVAAIARLIVC